MFTYFWSQVSTRCDPTFPARSYLHKRKFTKWLQILTYPYNKLNPTLKFSNSGGVDQVRGDRNATDRVNSHAQTWIQIRTHARIHTHKHGRTILKYSKIFNVFLRLKFDTRGFSNFFFLFGAHLGTGMHTARTHARTHRTFRTHFTRFFISVGAFFPRFLLPRGPIPLSAYLCVFCVVSVVCCVLAFYGRRIVWFVRRSAHHWRVVRQKAPLPRTRRSSTSSQCDRRAPKSRPMIPVSAQLLLTMLSFPFPLSIFTTDLLSSLSSSTSSSFTTFLVPLTPLPIDNRVSRLISLIYSNFTLCNTSLSPPVHVWRH